MDAFAYLSVLLSIILGLAITQILQGYRGLLLSRSRVDLYAPSIVWSALLLVFAAQLWWASFGLAAHKEWDFAAFGVLLLQTVLLYMMSALVLPDVPASGRVELKAHYDREVVPFFATSLLMLCASIAKDWMLDDRLPAPANLAFHGFFAAMAILAIAVRKPRLHLAIALVMVVFSAVYVTLLFARLGQN